MEIIIRIKTDNAAFEFDKIEEIKRMIREQLTEERKRLIDYNGNHVGSIDWVND